MNTACLGGSTVTSRAPLRRTRGGHFRYARVPPVDYRDNPPSNETGSRFNRRNRPKWVRIQRALTRSLAQAPGPSGTRLLLLHVCRSRTGRRPAESLPSGPAGRVVLLSSAQPVLLQTGSRQAGKLRAVGAQKRIPVADRLRAGIPQQLYPYPIHAWQQGLRWWREPQSTEGRYLMLQWPLLWLDGKRQRETRTRNNQALQSNPLGPDILLRNWNPQPTLGGNSRRPSLSQRRCV